MGLGVGRLVLVDKLEEFHQPPLLEEPHLRAATFQNTATFVTKWLQDRTLDTPKRAFRGSCGSNGRKVRRGEGLLRVQIFTGLCVGLDLAFCAGFLNLRTTTGTR